MEAQEGGPAKREAEIGVVQEYQEPPEPGASKAGFSPRGFEWSVVLPTPWFGLLAPRTVREHFYCFKAT